MILSMGTEQNSNHEEQGKRRKGESHRMGKENDPQNNKMQRHNAINNAHDAQVTGFHDINENLITMAKNDSTICMDVCKKIQISFFKCRGGWFFEKRTAPRPR